MSARMTLKPGTLDTIVATNLHADILSDLAAALTGSLGIAPTSNLNPEGRFPSMFEPIHGSAFDITGKGIANPIGAFWTGALLLDHVGEKRAAARLLSTIEGVVADKANHCPDLGGQATTRKSHGRGDRRVERSRQRTSPAGTCYYPSLRMSLSRRSASAPAERIACHFSKISRRRGSVDCWSAGRKREAISAASA
jgi:Isocitrate/isopropylmalate dehydrogenase